MPINSDAAEQGALFGDLAEDVLKTAEISPDGGYRYRLTRVWGDVQRILPWVMLNPSTADHTVDDPTIRRCMSFARIWGYGGITVVNLYALRSTDPARLWTVLDPIGGYRNDDVLRETFRAAAESDLPVIAAWGANADPKRAEFAAVLAKSAGATLHALALTKDGQPRHPLYLRSDARPTPWEVPS